MDDSRTDAPKFDLTAQPSEDEDVLLAEPTDLSSASVPPEKKKPEVKPTPPNPELDARLFNALVSPVAPVRLSERSVSAPTPAPVVPEPVVTTPVALEPVEPTPPAEEPPEAPESATETSTESPVDGPMLMVQPVALVVPDGPTVHDWEPLPPPMRIVADDPVVDAADPAVEPASNEVEVQAQPEPDLPLTLQAEPEPESAPAQETETVAEPEPEPESDVEPELPMEAEAEDASEDEPAPVVAKVWDPAAVDDPPESDEVLSLSPADSGDAAAEGPWSETPIATLSNADMDDQESRAHDVPDFAEPLPDPEPLLAASPEDLNPIPAPAAAIPSSSPDAPPGRTGAWWTLPMMCLGLAMVACAVLVPAADENRRDLHELAKLERDVTYFQQQSEVNKQFLEHVSTDPTLAERLAQRQLRMTRADSRVVQMSKDRGPFSMSPYALVTIDPPPPMPEYRSMGGFLSRCFLDTKGQIYLTGLGILLTAAGVILGGGEPRKRSA